MRCTSLYRQGHVDEAGLAVIDRPDPVPGPGEVLIAVRACACCRTDLQIVEGDLALHHRPIVPGHQAVGIVLERGPGVEGVAIGDRVGVGWLAGACGQCTHCTHGRENLCEKASFTGWDRDGGFATRLVARHDFVFPIPSGFTDLAAAPLLCGGVIGYRAFRLTGLSSGARLGLYGFGASARLTIQVARHFGCEVFVATRSGREQSRAMDLGAVWTGSYGERPPRPLDAAITFAPAGEVVLAALRAVDRGGIVVINAIHLDRIPPFPYELLWWERSLKSVANYTRADAREFLALAAKIPIRTDFEVHPLGDTRIALERLQNGTASGASVIHPS